jgi:hypothetical protein
MPADFVFPWTGADGRQRTARFHIDDDGVPRRVGDLERRECKGCEGPSIVVAWCGVRWHGTPLPRRHLLHWFGLDTPADWRGCGCIVKLKATTSGLARLWRDVRRA